MASRKYSSLFLITLFYSIIGSSVSISPVSSPPYFPIPNPSTPAPNSDATEPSYPVLAPISYPPQPMSPIPSPTSYPPVSASPMPATPTWAPYPPPSESASPMPATPTPPSESAPPMPATPTWAPYPPSSESAPPMPATPTCAPYPPPPPSESAPPMPAVPSPNPSPMPPYQGIKGAYWPSFTGFSISSIDTSYFTHLYYAFLLPDQTTYKLAITPNDEQMLPEFTSILRTQKSPAVKTILSIGGGGSDPTLFSKIASTNVTRSIFIHSAIEVARKYRFDGVDLDWEFPANQDDMSNLGLLFKEWRKALNMEAMATGRPRLLLTSAVYFASNFFLSDVPRSYPIESIRRYVDWVSPMCFDYHGNWSNFTGAQAALYDPTSNVSTSYGIHSWIDVGVPARKVVMGLPIYGRTWTLKDPNVHGIGADAVGVGPGNGIMTYSEVIDFNNLNNATVVYDGSTVSMYSYAGDAWIGYDDPTSVKTKVQFARSHGIGGYFFWALGQDRDWTISRQASTAWDH